MGQLVLSKSSVNTYLNCPRSYWFSYIDPLRTPRKLTYPQLLGSTVHQFIARMHSSTHYPLFYKSLDNARSAWFWTWRNAVELNVANLQSQSDKETKEAGLIGWFCVQFYWRQNINKPAPLFIEKRYVMQVFAGVKFVGVLDQIRQAPIEKIAEIRPELVIDGKLKDGYDPVAIVDLKTSKHSYDLRKFKPEATDLELAAYQFDLHEDFQTTAYSWLYYRVHKSQAVAFYWYHLRDGKAFMTYREKGDFETFADTINHIVNGINEESFPKHETLACKYCDFFEKCGQQRKDRPLMVSAPTNGVDLGGQMKIWPQELPAKVRQLKFKFPSAKKMNIENE